MRCKYNTFLGLYVINWKKVLLILLNTLSLSPDNQDIIT